VPSKVGILHDLGCPDNMFFCNNKNKTIGDLAVETPSLSTLVSLLVRADLAPLFFASSGGPYTVFAPSNAAFEALPQSVLEFLTADSPESKLALQEILTYHVLSPAVERAAAFKGDASFPTVEGTAVIGSKNGLFGNDVNQASIVLPDLKATNGIVHVIDQVLNPQTTLEVLTRDESDLTTLVAALTATNLLGNFDKCAPGAPSLTLFAPTNDAFQNVLVALGVDLETLIADGEGDTLKTILLYHVVAGFAEVSELIAGDGITQTLAELPITVEIAPSHDGEASTEEILINADLDAGNGVEIIVPDVPSCTGIVQKIDKVLIPPGFQGLVREQERRK